MKDNLGASPLVNCPKCGLRFSGDPACICAHPCKWCKSEGMPEWSPYAKVWIHRRESLDKACLNPPNSYGHTSQVPAETISTERRQGHSALRIKDGKMETFDPHPLGASPSEVMDKFESWYVDFGEEAFNKISDREYVQDDCTDMRKVMREVAILAWLARTSSSGQGSTPDIRGEQKR